MLLPCLIWISGQFDFAHVWLIVKIPCCMNLHTCPDFCMEIRFGCCQLLLHDDGIHMPWLFVNAGFVVVHDLFVWKWIPWLLNPSNDSQKFAWMLLFDFVFLLYEHYCHTVSMLLGFELLMLAWEQVDVVALLPKTLAARNNSQNVWSWLVVVVDSLRMPLFHWSENQSQHFVV